MAKDLEGIIKCQLRVPYSIIYSQHTLAVSWDKTGDFVIGATLKLVGIGIPALNFRGIFQVTHTDLTLVTLFHVGSYSNYNIFYFRRKTHFKPNSFMGLSDTAVFSCSGSP